MRTKHKRMIWVISPSNDWTYSNFGNKIYSDKYPYRKQATQFITSENGFKTFSYFLRPSGHPAYSCNPDIKWITEPELCDLRPNSTPFPQNVFMEQLKSKLLILLCDKWNNLSSVMSLLASTHMYVKLIWLLFEDADVSEKRVDTRE